MHPMPGVDEQKLDDDLIPFILLCLDFEFGVRHGGYSKTEIMVAIAEAMMQVEPRPKPDEMFLTTSVLNGALRLAHGVLQPQLKLRMPHAPTQPGVVPKAEATPAPSSQGPLEADRLVRTGLVSGPLPAPQTQGGVAPPDVP